MAKNSLFVQVSVVGPMSHHDACGHVEPSLFPHERRRKCRAAARSDLAACVSSAKSQIFIRLSCKLTSHPAGVSFRAQHAPILV